MVVKLQQNMAEHMMVPDYYNLNLEAKAELLFVLLAQLYHRSTQLAHDVWPMVIIRLRQQVLRIDSIYHRILGL